MLKRPVDPKPQTTGVIQINFHGLILIKQPLRGLHTKPKRQKVYCHLRLIWSMLGLDCKHVGVSAFVNSNDSSKCKCLLFWLPDRLTFSPIRKLAQTYSGCRKPAVVVSISPSGGQSGSNLHSSLQTADNNLSVKIKVKSWEYIHVDYYSAFGKKEKKRYLCNTLSH